MAELAKEVPGRNAPRTWFGGWLKGFLDLNDAMGKWAEEHRAKNGGAPVFFSQAGIKAIAVTDAVSAEFIFNAPQDLLSRLNRTGFGPVKLQPPMIGPVRPALVSSFEGHKVNITFLDLVMRARLGAFDAALSDSADALFARWESEQQVVLLEEIRNFGAQVIARWLLDIDLDGPSAGVWLANAVTLNTDSRLANALLSTFKPVPKSAIETTQKIHAQMRTSPHYDEVCRLGKEQGLDEEHAISQLAFMMLFNSAAPGFSHFSTLCQLDATPKWGGIVRDEVGDDKLTPSNVDQYQKLHQVFLEANRLYSLPRLFYRTAHGEFDLPCGNGDSYRIRPGDDLFMVMRSVYRDPSVFKNPQDFEPERYAEGNDLGRYDWIFGAPKEPYRCAGAKVGIAARWWKYILARLLQGYEWELSPRPKISVNYQNGGSPDDLKLVNFRKRT